MYDLKEDNAKKATFLKERYKRLGFYPQKEIFCNNYLPYADCLDDESQNNLILIKDNLARAVALREMPSISMMLKHLLGYIKLYGLKFSKEDHVKFIKLILSLLEIPDLEPLRLNQFCTILSHLLRKSTWLSPDDIEIDWKPLYKIGQLFILKNSKKGDLYRCFPSLETNLQYIIQQCAPYFGNNATREILDEIYPKLFPLDTGKVCDTFELLSLFLNSKNNYELWFHESMNLWDSYHNPTWNSDLMNMVAGISADNIGLIDWEPYIPTMFTRFLRSLDLPVCYKSMKSSRAQGLWSSSVAVWITCTLGPNSSTQQYLTKFLGAIESYLHPANSGKWVNTISEILVQLPKYFFDRLIRERYKPHPWKKPIADEHKLTEKCINDFVESFKPIAFQAVYSRVSATDVGKIFKHLADLRPEVIIPGVIEQVYSTLESLTKPHKMTAALQCLVSVSRALVSGHNGYTLGKTHVIPILYLTLPGIDPNDFRKTSITLEFLTNFALLVPIIDCSRAGHHYDDLTDEELLICDQTAEFEGFVLQYMDKIFTLIESSAQESIRMEQSETDNLRSKLEAIAETLLQSSTHGILGQCSKEIILAATKKLVDFIKTHLFEPRVAAHLVASLVRVFSRVAGSEMRKLFVPYLIQTINTYIAEHDDIAEIDKQNDEMLYYIILLMSVARGDPKEVLSFVDDVIPIIDKISKFKCKLTNRYANSIILNILSNVSTIQTIDVRSSPESFDKPLAEFLPIRHWGEKSEAPVQWYVPDEQAKLVCQMIIHRYLPPILDQFESYVEGKIPLTRDDVLRDTSTVLALLKCENLLPNWDTEEPLKNDNMLCERVQLQIRLGFETMSIHMPDGSNVRLAVIRTMTKLQNKILEESEDDIKSFKALVLLWARVHMRRQYTTPFDAQLKSFKSLKMFQEYNLTRKRRDIRAIMATRVLMQQDCRDELSPPEFTESHKTIMFNLLKLSTSHYSAIRSLAQARLFVMINLYYASYKYILDDIVGYLSMNSNENHEQFKGILYVIGGTRRSRLIVHNNWTAIEKIWLALLRTNLSEKPSVVRLLDMIMDAMHNEFPTLAIKNDVPDNCVELAMRLTVTNIATNEEMIAAKQKLDQSNAKNLQTYLNILKSIIDITHNNSLHWRYGLMASGMILNLVHPNCNLPAEIVNYCVHNLINDSIEERKIALRTLRYIFRQQKREHKKLSVDPFAIAGVKRPSTSIGILKPGIRPDNEWLLYDVNRVPKNQQEWDAHKYSHKTEGFFGWSSSFWIYAPSSEQPKLHRSRSEMTESEQILYDFCFDPKNIDKLIEFWSLEEKKGKDKFNRFRYYLIKYLCAMFGNEFAETLLPHIKRLIEHKDIESNHRCAAELMGGIMRGMKHWPYDETSNMYELLKPLIRLALNNITVDTDIFWGTCFATAAENFDPRRQYWLHEVLLEDPLRESTSFIDCSRIFCLQGPLNQHVWRMGSVAHRLLDYLRPYLNHSFQNVRERLGGVLINIFEADLAFSGSAEPSCPRIHSMIAEVVDKMQILNVDDTAAAGKSILKKDRYVDPMETSDEHSSSVNSVEYDKAVRLFKTICQWLVGVLNRNTNGNISSYFELMPFACRLERSEQDAELSETCSSLLAMLSQSLTLSDCMHAALNKIDAISKMASWSARLSVIDVLQVLVFNNMFIVLSKDEWVTQVQVIVLRLLEDSVLEVREKAAQVLGGLLHCSFLPSTDKLLELFKKKCKTKVIRNVVRRTAAATYVPNTCAGEVAVASSASSSNNSLIQVIDTQEADSVRMRHMGVLGLCAFISAYPYDIPDFVPDVFEHLGAHLNDPQPIPSTIRKTVGDFKRTHHDNWATHQLKFTENQLAVLSDLTIPPSYYA